MADLPSWADPSTILGGGGLLAGIGAVVKTVLDWRKDRGHDRQTSEELVRDDLRAELVALREDNRTMRAELAAARTEMRQMNEAAESRFRVHADSSEKRLQECEDRATRFRQELSEIRARIGRVEG